MTKRVIYIVLAMTLCMSCQKSIVLDIDHPTQGKLLLSTYWVGAEGIVPDAFTVECAKTQSKVTLSGKTVEYPNLLTPGEYTLNLYNESEDITLTDYTATVVSDEQGIKAQPTTLYYGTLTKEIERNKEYTETVIMQPITGQIEFEIHLSGDRINDITNIQATLSGVAERWELKNSITVGKAITIAPIFTKTGNKLTAMVRLLGVVGAEQKLTITLTYIDQTTQTEEYDYSVSFSKFNDNKRSIKHLNAELETPLRLNFDVGVDDWENAEQ